jgi:hypothetical protein
MGDQLTKAYRLMANRKKKSRYKVLGLFLRVQRYHHNLFWGSVDFKIVTSLCFEDKRERAEVVVAVDDTNTTFDDPVSLLAAEVALGCTRDCGGIVVLEGTIPTLHATLHLNRRKA